MVVGVLVVVMMMFVGGHGQAFRQWESVPLATPTPPTKKKNETREKLIALRVYDFWLARKEKRKRPPRPTPRVQTPGHSRPILLNHQPDNSM